MKLHLPYNVITAVIVALGGFIFGFDASVISGVVGFVTVEFSLNELQQGMIVGAPTLGAVLGSLFAGPSADRWGRKTVLIVIAALYIVSAALSAFSINYQMLVAARFIGGLAFASLVLAPMYIAEISPAKRRGKMISINQFNIVIGFSAAYFANDYLLQVSREAAAWAVDLGIDQHVWRWMLGIELVPAVLYLLLLFTIPRSPRWLVSKGHISEAKKVVQVLFPHQTTDSVLDEIQQGQEGKPPALIERLKRLFKPSMKKVLLVGILVGVCQQVTGVNAVYFYAPSIFEQSGVGQDAAFSQAIWVGIINVIFTIIAMLLIDKLGRKPLMLIGLCGVVISMSVAAYGFNQATYKLSDASLSTLDNTEIVAPLAPLVGKVFESDVQYKVALKSVLTEDEYRANEAALISAAANMDATLILFGILGFVASFAVSLGPVMWVLLAEIFPNDLRGVGIALTGLINSAVSFTVQFLFPYELANFGAAFTFGLYGAFALVGFFLVLKYLPETKGKDLEQVQQAFQTHARKPDERAVATENF